MTKTLLSKEQKLEFYLEKALELEQADMGFIRSFDFLSNTLKVILERGTDGAFPDQFYVAKPFDNSACGRAAGLCKTVVIEDVEQDIGLMPYRETLRKAGFRSIKSIPLIHIDGTLRGVLCMICRHPRWGWETNILNDLLCEITACIA
jgi:GAF domain-containing protein